VQSNQLTNSQLSLPHGISNWKKDKKIKQTSEHNKSEKQSKSEKVVQG